MITFFLCFFGLHTYDEYDDCVSCGGSREEIEND